MGIVDIPTQKAPRYPWVDGFDAVFDEVFFREASDTDEALRNVGIFACKECIATHNSLFDDELAKKKYPASLL